MNTITTTSNAKFLHHRPLTALTTLILGRDAHRNLRRYVTLKHRVQSLTFLGICSGKKTVARYLVEHHGFTQLYLRQSSDTAANRPTSSNGHHFSDQWQGQSQTATTSSPKAFSGAQSPFALATKDGINESNPDTSLALPPSVPAHIFTTPEDLLDFVTKRWRSRFVTTDVP